MRGKAREEWRRGVCETDRKREGGKGEQRRRGKEDKPSVHNIHSN